MSTVSAFLVPQRSARIFQRGAASLVVVMVLFFVMSLVAAYTSRNLIFEQRTSMNQYRSTQAFEAAEAGLEWALTMLNGGRIGADCTEATATATDTSFRQRYVVFNAAAAPNSPNFAPNSTTLWPVCVWGGSSWTCSCPVSGTATLSAPSGTGIHPAFAVRFTSVGVSRPGVVRVEAQGCTRYVTGTGGCLDFTSSTVELEGVARLTVLAALKNAITTPPAAPISLTGSVLGGASVTAYNTNVDQGGVTIHAGGNVVNPGLLTLQSLPGAPAADSIVAADTVLSAMAADPNRAFAAVFGAWPSTYRLQPATVQLDCPATGCFTELRDAIARNPERVIWITGDLSLETAGDIGSATGPAAIVVNGRVRFLTSNVHIYGLVYATNGNWSGDGNIHGATFVNDDLGAAATHRVYMDKAILDILRLRQGSFVRLPSSWRDFQ